MKDPGDSLPTRHSLLLRLRNWDDQESWREFFETYWRLIYGVARQAGLSDTDAQDVVQDTVLTVAKTMPGYEYRPADCSFKTWLHLLTRRRIADRLRRLSREPSAGAASLDENPSLAEAAENPQFPSDTQWDEAWQKNLFAVALERVKQQSKPLHYQIFDCCALKHWSASEVARALNVSLAEVYLAKHRITARLRRETARLEKEMPK
jgi:RNA polymerase sigma-70 factor (ECF subfamily)